MKIYKVCYKSNNFTKEIGKGRTFKEANKVIHRYLKLRNYKSYYQRYWLDAYDTLWVDIGSWSEFFTIKKEVI